MKKINKLILTMFAVFAVAIIMKVPTSAATSAKQVACTENSVTIQWTRESSDRAYAVTTSSARPASYNMTTSQTSVTVPLPANYTGDLYVHYKWGTYSDYDNWCRVEVNTLPTALGAGNFGIASVLTYTKKVEVACNKLNPEHGYYLQLFKGNTLVGQYECNTYSDYLPIATNTLYKYRVLPFYKNYQNGQTYAAANWSPLRQFVLPTMKGKTKSNKKGINITLYRTAGVSKYVLGISKKSGSGYKNVKSIAVKKSKKSFKITKKYYKRKTNYIKITPVIAGYGNSDISSQYSIFVWK